jgi:GntR family transcriptional regulator
VIDYDAADPPYKQVADAIARRILSGQLAPGARVPSITTLVQDYGIAKNTARRALTVLAEQGLVRIVPGWGTFVVDQLP